MLDFPRPPEQVQSSSPATFQASAAPTGAAGSAEVNPLPAMLLGTTPTEFSGDAPAAHSSMNAGSTGTAVMEEIAGAGAPPPAPAAPETAPIASIPEPSAPTPTSTPTPSATPDVAAFSLQPVAFRMTGNGLALPLTALSPVNRSPAFSWSGVPAGTKSLALVDYDATLRRVRWVMWDIPASVTSLPEGILPLPMPIQVPGSSQLGSVSAGYSGPPPVPSTLCQFTLWALDVARVPDTFLLDANRLVEERLPQHQLAKTAPLLVTSGF